MMKNNKLLIVVLSLLLLSTGVVRAQETVRVYFETSASPEEKTSAREVIRILNDFYGRVIADSINRFNGKGIYFTTRDRDKFRQYPSKLSSYGDEGFYIKSTNAYAYVCANTAEGLRQGMYRYLQQLGFRYYFPNPAWHIKPTSKKIYQSFELLTRPDFAYRKITPGWGYGSDRLAEQYYFWERTNGMGGSLQTYNVHAYYGLVADNRAAFEANRDYLSKPLVNGNVQWGTTLNYGLPAVSELAWRWLATQFDAADRRGKPVPMLSLEPFDGPSYSDLAAARRVGSNASDQVFYFTNEVAKKLRRTHPGKKIGILAYNDHIDIPRYNLEDNIFVTLTNGFNTSKYSTDELISRWKTKTKSLGIYMYYSVFESNRDLPGAGMAASYPTVVSWMKKLSKAGVSSYQAETTYAWIPKGIGHFLTAALAWDTGTDTAAVLTKFYRDCFPQTQSRIRPLFESWNGNPLITENELYNWFSILQTAMNECNDVAELQRLQQIGLYLHYVRLQKEYSEVPAAQRNQKTTELLAYLAEIMEEGVVASYAALNIMPGEAGMPVTTWGNEMRSAYRTKAAVSFPRSKKDWQQYTRSYLSTLKRTGDVRLYNAAPFLSAQEVKAMGVPGVVHPFGPSMTFQGNITMLIDTKRSDSAWMKLKGGRLNPSGRLTVKVYPWNNNLRPGEAPLSEAYYTANDGEVTVDFRKLQRNKYIVVIEDNDAAGVTAYFPHKLTYSIVASATSPLQGGFYNYFYFYVPKGTRKFYIYKTDWMRVYDAGNKMKESPTAENLLEFNVTDADAGWWSVHYQMGRLHLLGVPPLISREPRYFFMPD